ncbi:hypothetical protein TRVA0_020S00672 [Trichomonascus vanleenenianus]|uniref:uncharacterized protein n=1 Tax=Trichomonascus vanleenenianus TaxID=2268995 RepID=UPI003ECAD587
MEKTEESKQSAPSDNSSENEEGIRVNWVDPSEFFGSEQQRVFDALPEDVKRRYLEESNGINDIGELLRLTAWAFGHHPGLKPSVTLGVEDIPGQGLAVVARQDQSRSTEGNQPADQVSPEDEGEKKVLMAVDVRRGS